MTLCKGIMITNINLIKVKNLFLKNEILNLDTSTEDLPPLTEISALRLETKIHINDNHNFFYNNIQTFLDKYFENHTLWIFISCLSVPNNKITRHKKLWKSSMAKDLKLSQFSYHSKDLIVESNKKSTLDISGLIRVSKKDLSHAIQLLSYNSYQTTMFLSKEKTFESEMNIKYIHENFYNETFSYQNFLLELVSNNSIIIRSGYKHDQFAPYIDFFMKYDSFSKILGIGDE